MTSLNAVIINIMQKISFKVSNTIKKYLGFLCHEWTGEKMSKAIDYLKNKESRHYLKELSTSLANTSTYIATRLNRNSEEFDEKSLYSGLEKEHGANFISKHLLKNKEIAYIIYHRNPTHAVNGLVEEYSDCFSNKKPKAIRHVEDVYGIPFYTVESTLFESNSDHPSDRCFMWKEFKRSTRCLTYYFSIADPRK